MNKSMFFFLVAFFVVVAVAEAEDIKTYLVGYLQSLDSNGLTEAELNAKTVSELVDMVNASLEKLKAEAKDPERAKAIEAHMGYFAELKAESTEETRKSPARSEPFNGSNQVSNKVHHVDSEEDFDNQVKNAGSKLVVVDFFATWCGPCKRIAPVLDTFAEKYASQIVMLKVDVDQLNELSSGRFAVSSMPTFVFLKDDGKIVERFSGADATKIEETIKKYSN